MQAVFVPYFSNMTSKYSPSLQESGRLKVSYIHGGLAQYRAGETLGPRTLTDYELVMIQQGTIVYELNGHKTKVPEGGVLLTRPGFEEKYCWDTKGRTRHAYLHFDIDTYPSDWPDESKWPVTKGSVPAAVAALFQELVERIYKHSDWPAKEPDQDSQRLLETLISLYLKAGGKGSPEENDTMPYPVRRAVDRMRQIIDEDAHYKITLAELAKVAGVSPQHLCRLFTNTVGHAPLQTFKMIQLQLALVLLIRSNLAIKEIAERCGFDDPFYFSRSYLKAYGESPRKTQQRVKSGGAPPKSPLLTSLVPRIFW